MQSEKYFNSGEVYEIELKKIYIYIYFFLAFWLRCLPENEYAQTSGLEQISIQGVFCWIYYYNLWNNFECNLFLLQFIKFKYKGFICKIFTLELFIEDFKI